MLLLSFAALGDNLSPNLSQISQQSWGVKLAFRALLVSGCRR